MGALEAGAPRSVSHLIFHISDPTSPIPHLHITVLPTNERATDDIFSMGQAQSTPNVRRVAAPISEKFPNHDNMEDSVMVEKTGESYDGKPFAVN